MITAQKLTKQYGHQFALNNVDVSIENNEITGLIGPNGAGKSTLMKIICGLLPPSGGHVLINNEKVEINNKKQRQAIGYLPEENPLYNEMYVKEYLLYVAGIYTIADKHKAVGQVIGATALEKEQHKKIGELSKGYKQRVGLAQAIIHDPEILILDEPTSGLDPNQMTEIRNLIRSLGQNKTVLLSTHNLHEVETICQKVIVINNGRVVKQGATDTMRSESQKNLVVEFDKSPEEKQLLEINGVKGARHVKGATWIISMEKDKDIRADVFSFAVQHNMVVLSSHVQEQKLEEIFHELTKKG
jgi:ABC-2 type transport system ATP-binding protein